MKIVGNKRLLLFAQQSTKQHKYIRCTLMVKKHIDQLDIPEGFTIIYADTKPYIGKLQNCTKEKS